MDRDKIHAQTISAEENLSIAVKSIDDFMESLKKNPYFNYLKMSIN